MKELAELTISKAIELLEEKKISSEELTKSCLKKIKKLNKKLNAYITIFEKEAIEQARESDKRRVRGESYSKLDGIPLAVKDNICIENTLTTCASKILSNFISPIDARVIEKLKKAGLVFLGKANMDEFAMGSSTETSYYGPVKNPWDLSRVPGGSSGGSAAAVAADTCLGAFGSDTGGSIRHPASFCGVVGLKPTYGRVSRYGLVAYGSSLDQIGPITKNVLDTAILLNTISGYDPLDSTSVKIKVPDYTKTLQGGVKRLKVGLVKEFFGSGMDKEVEKKVKEAAKKMEDLGFKIEEMSLPFVKYALPAYYIVALAEASSNLARFDGIKYGFSVETQNLLDVYLKSRQEGFGDEVRRRIMLGTYCLSAGYYEAYYLKAKKVQAKVVKDFKKAFEKFDLLLTPVSPTVAFKIGEKIKDPLTMYLGDVHTVPINPAGLPAISIPCGLVNNLPIGLQIIGNHFDEETILKTAYLYEQNTDWHKKKCKI